MERRTAANGVTYYASPLFGRRGVSHAFSTRLGGVSPAPFDSLNLGNPNSGDVQDAGERIEMNYARLFDAAGCRDRRLCRAKQVHGAHVIRVSSRDGSPEAEADALITDDPRAVASVR